MCLAAERRPRIRRAPEGAQAREPDPLVALHIVGVDNAAETGGKEQRCGGGGAVDCSNRVAAPRGVAAFGAALRLRCGAGGANSRRAVRRCRGRSIVVYVFWPYSAPSA